MSEKKPYGFIITVQGRNFLAKQVEILSSIVNTLLIIFYFEEYVKFDENTEKSLIRSAISNDLGYKKSVAEVLEEI